MSNQLERFGFNHRRYRPALCFCGPVENVAYAVFGGGQDVGVFQAVAQAQVGFLGQGVVGGEYGQLALYLAPKICRNWVTGGCFCNRLECV
nr:hypothetical protein [Saccharospirillum impatiens]